MSQSLPLRANLEWLKKVCKERLAELKSRDPATKLSEAQLTIARDYGFASWRKLKAHVEQVRDALDVVTSSMAASAGGDPNSVPADDPELAELFAAVEAGETDRVLELLRRRPILAKAYGPEGQTALHVAAQFNDPHLGLTLLSCGADPQARFGGSGHTALSWAVTCNSIEFAQTLAQLGIKPDLFCAAGIGALGHVRAYFDSAGNLTKGASRTGSSRYHSDGTLLPCPPETPREVISDALYIACRNARPDVVRFLLGHQPDLSFRAYHGGMPLHWAYFGGSLEVIELLLQAGADPTARDSYLHCTPRAFGICVPANWGFLFLVRMRLQQDPTLAHILDGRTSPLHEAVRSGNVDIVRLLLAAGAKPTTLNDDGQTPFDIASQRGHTAVMEILRV